MTRLAALLVLLAPAAAAGPLDQAALSARLQAEGQAQQDPLLLIAAARLRKSAGFVPDSPLPMGWQVMLDQATALAGDDPTLLALIEDTAAETMKGVATGPVTRLDDLAPGTTDRFPALEIAADQRTEVYVEPQAATDLNLTIRDASGTLLCTDTDPDPIAYCAWTQPSPATVTIEVSNAGPDPTPYALMTN